MNTRQGEKWRASCVFKYADTWTATCLFLLPLPLTLTFTFLRMFNKDATNWLLSATTMLIKSFKPMNNYWKRRAVKFAAVLLWNKLMQQNSFILVWLLPQAFKIAAVTLKTATTKKHTKTPPPPTKQQQTKTHKEPKPFQSPRSVGKTSV